MNVEDHPIVEQLMRDAAPRAAARLPARERVVEASVGLALVLAIAGLAIATGAPLPEPLNLVVGIVAYMAARRVEFRVGAGTAGPTQPVLVVMLLDAPALGRRDRGDRRGAAGPRARLRLRAHAPGPLAAHAG